MRKRVTALLVVLVMVLALPAQAMAFQATAYLSDLSDYDLDRAVVRSDLAAFETDLGSLTSVLSVGEMTKQEVIAYLLLFAGMKESQLGEYPRDYNFMAKSVGLLDGVDFDDPEELCPFGDFLTMLDNVGPLYDALNGEQMEPFFVNGMAQPIFVYEDAIRFCVYVESNYDTDGDGKLDLVKTLVQLPRDVLDGMKVATIFEARPYITGTLRTQNPPIPSSATGYDISSLYSQPAPRTPSGEEWTTAEAAEVADPDDWYYYNPVENEWVYEDLTWYDYYLVRGFAVVSSGGIGTKGSEGFETCGTNFEIDAFKCIIEWLTGDRIAYTDKENNIEIKADWSNGKVGMTGRSYAGTTQFGLATTGVKGLETIVPVAGIASWYEYTNMQGMSNSSGTNYSEGLAWYCNGRYLDAEDYAAIEEKYLNYLYQLRLDQWELNGDYGEHWAVRDYTIDWENIQCPALIVHGTNDTNVRTKQSDLMARAYEKAGVDYKMIWHQGAHVTPTYPAGGYEMYIDDLLYDEVLNKWFSHYLYGVDNGVEDLPAVTAQRNIDGGWEYYDSWSEYETLRLNGNDINAEGLLTITSNYSSNGITSSNYMREFMGGTTGSSALYSVELTEDVILKGAVEINLKAAVNYVEEEGAEDLEEEEDPEAAEGDDVIEGSDGNAADPVEGEDPEDIIDGDGETGEDRKDPEEVDDEIIDEDVEEIEDTDDGSSDTIVDGEIINIPDGDFIDRDNFVNPENHEELSVTRMSSYIDLTDSVMGEPIGRDPLQMSAMLVDIYDPGFTTYSTSGTQVPTDIIEAGGAWMGGGLDNFNLVEYRPSNVTYKVISQSWMDLNNPDAKYDSHTAVKRDEEIVAGEFYDYSLYLQPNLYTLEEGHTLAVIVYTHTPGSSRFSGEYTITIDTDESYINVPVSDAPTTIDPPEPPEPEIDVNILRYKADKDSVITSEDRLPLIITNTLTIEDPDNFSMITMYVEYDADLFEYVSNQSLCEDMPVFSVDKIRDGRIRVILGQAGGSRLKADGEVDLARLQFRSVSGAQPEEAVITVADIEVYESSKLLDFLLKEDTATTAIHYVDDIYDVDANGIVNWGDLAYAMDHYMKSAEDYPDFYEGIDGLWRMDLDGDGVITMNDYLILMAGIEDALGLSFSMKVLN